MKRLLLLTALATPLLANGAQVFTTDVIVQGSECIGVDCSSSETFSFDTLRLKENNLRLHFDDTSASASFPANDWRFTFNDSGNGGASFFSVDDATSGKVPFKIEAGAPNNTLFVATEGRIGIKTSTPVVDIHNVNGNTPTLRLEQDGSSGFASQTWDMAGNETNFFIRDVTNGSKLPFRIKPNSPKNSIYINSTGVGMGTESPDAKLHVVGTGIFGESDLGAPSTSAQLQVLSNTGEAAIGFEDNDSAKAWTVGIGNDAYSSATNVFKISTNQSQGAELIMYHGGSMVLQKSNGAGGGTTIMDMNNSGTLTVSDVVISYDDGKTLSMKDLVSALESQLNFTVPYN